MGGAGGGQLQSTKKYWGRGARVSVVRAVAPPHLTPSLQVTVRFVLSVTAGVAIHSPGVGLIFAWEAFLMLQDSGSGPGGGLRAISRLYSETSFCTPGGHALSSTLSTSLWEPRGAQFI